MADETNKEGIQSEKLSDEQLEGAAGGVSLSTVQVQDFMSRYNQSEQFAGSIQKKQDDVDLSILDKV